MIMTRVPPPLLWALPMAGAAGAATAETRREAVLYLWE